MHMQIYNNLYEALMGSTVAVDHYIFVDTEAEVSYQRMRSRARDGETHLSPDYLESCNRWHQVMLSKIPKERVTVFNGNLPIEERDSEIDLLVEKISSFSF